MFSTIIEPLRDLAEQNRDLLGFVVIGLGNFGLGVAYAANRLGHPAEIFVPSTSPPLKVQSIRSYGATVHVIEGYYADAFAAWESSR